ncbi:MAG: HAD hydrolase family protein [Verrucomicrobia bacterium]|nr:HAD hydrolase family protein [Verrucomicrobiota bacterium]
MPPPPTKTLVAKLARVRLFLCDVDGVLTDGTVSIGSSTEIKRFGIRDGLGLRILQRAGIRVGWISNRPSLATAERARELKVDFLHQDRGSKVAAAEAILNQARADWSEVCYVGDDIVDLAMLRRAGVAVVVSNGVAEAKAAADYVTRAPGGQGAVREVVELILKAQKKWSGVVRDYSEGAL